MDVNNAQILVIFKVYLTARYLEVTFELEDKVTYPSNIPYILARSFTSVLDEEKQGS